MRVAAIRSIVLCVGGETPAETKTMHTPDRHLSCARSKANRADTRKDERRAFTRAVRRTGKIDPRDVEPDTADDTCA